MKKFCIVLLTALLALALFACTPPGGGPEPEEPVILQVTLNAGDGEFANETATKVVEVEKGTKLTLAEEPENGDFVLEDWYTDADFYTRWNMNSVVNASMTLYAYWATNAEHFEYESNGDGTAELTSFIGDPVSDLRIPNYITNNVGSRDKITTLGGNFMNNAAYFGSLTSLTLPKTLTFIGYWAFYSQSELLEVEVPCSIDENVFRGNSKMERVVFKGEEITVGNAAFHENPAMVYADIKGVVSLGQHVFNGSNLETVVKDDNLSYIGDAAFQNNAALTEFDFTGVITIRDWAFYGCGFTEVDFPDLANLGTNTFQTCASLTTVTFGPAIESIGNSAFNGLSALTSVTIGGSGVAIGSSAFRSTGITTIDLSGVATIGSSAFRSTGLTTINLTGVTSVGESAFQSCASLASITLGGTVSTIGNYAFRATAITAIDLTGVTSIGAGALCESKLVNVVIPATVTTMGDDMFYSVTTLVSVDISATGILEGEANRPEGWSANWSRYLPEGATITYATAP